MHNELKHLCWQQNTQQAPSSWFNERGQIKNRIMEIATKFVNWEVPELSALQDSKVYQLREHLNKGGKLNRTEKNWLTEAINGNTYFRRGIPLRGWRFDFTDVVHLYWVKQFGHISEYYAVDKTALRSILHGVIDEIVELI